ncbi:type II secretion system major pseudopilin GspG [Salinibius halmophilus]|uniref:type II secretion system major pseudopilin GspG n=1 Tax=Salinibius halmophilus TaxID=1853216 RepID=UPI000E665222|nr:type II secretion system major pseudopilin GspG [Salinibius halmophilus]
MRMQKGFTLIELLVVLVILAMLAGVVVANFAGEDYKAAQKIVQSDFSTIEGSLKRFRLDVKRYPNTNEGLEALVNNPGINNWGGPYLDQLPTDPWNNAYDYELNGNNFRIISYGVDGEVGGEEENADLFSDAQ